MNTLVQSNNVSAINAALLSLVKQIEELKSQVEVLSKEVKDLKASSKN